MEKKMTKTYAQNLDNYIKQIRVNEKSKIKECKGGCGGKYIPTKSSPDMCIPCKYKNIKR